ncbi:PAS domain-containing protein [Salinithrix halophila]|uniref:PAS domain-containing protein n=1 Tax=Salinithrix halophila TaxID=1485204 RepID=A0ABV8JJD4_9BACL
MWYDKDKAGSGWRQAIKKDFLSEGIELSYNHPASGHGKKVSGLELLLDNQFALAIENMSAGVCITDPRLPDNPIVYVNPGFTELTGYTPEDVIGKNCRFLQSENTDRQAVHKLREAIHNGQSITTILLNRRKNGSLFWNELKINPVTDEKGDLVYYIGLQTDVTLRVQAKQDMALAAKVQRAMLPSRIDNERFRIEPLYIPYAFISGDSYDFYWDEEQSVLSGYLYDIMGHGVATALQSSALRVLFEQASKKNLTLAEKLGWVNNACLPYLADEYFIAAIAFELDFRRKVLTYSAGGINYFLASTLKHNGLVSAPGMFLGVFEGTSFQQGEIPFKQGDSFFFFSDGLFDLLPSPMKRFSSNFDRTVNWLQDLSQSECRRDDISALCIEIRTTG